MVDDFPRRQALILRRLPIARQFVRPEQPDLASPLLEDSRISHTGGAGILCSREYVGDAELALRKTRLLKPRDRKTCVGVEVTILLR